MPEVGSANVPYMIETPGVNFDAASFIDKYSTRMAELQLKKMEKEEKNKLYFQQNYHPSKIVPATIYTPFSNQIKKSIADYGDWYATKMAQGGNPNDPSLTAEMSKRQAEINNLNQMGKEVQDAIEANKKLVATGDGKHSLEDFNAWVKGMEGKSPEQMYDYVSKTPAFKYEFDPIDFLKDAGVTPQSIVSATGGKISTNREDVKGQIAAIIGSNEANQRKFFQNAMALTDKSGKPMFGPDAKYDDMLNYFTDQVMPFAKRDIYRPPSSKDDNMDSLESNYSSAMKTGTWRKDWNIQYVPSSDGAQGNISVTNKYEKDTAPILARSGGETFDFFPTRYIKDYKTGKVVVEGKKKIKKGDKTLEETTYIPFDENVETIISHLGGFDPRVYFDQKQGSSEPAKLTRGALD